MVYTVMWGTPHRSAVERGGPSKEPLGGGPGGEAVSKEAGFLDPRRSQTAVEADPIPPGALWTLGDPGCS